SISGPTSLTGALSASPTKSTQCGLPTETADASSETPSTEKLNLLVSTALESGTSFQSKRGAPISTVTSPSASEQTSGPPTVSSRIVFAPFSAISSCATQRAALPQLSTSPPSEL